MKTPFLASSFSAIAFSALPLLFALSGCRLPVAQTQTLAETKDAPLTVGVTPRKAILLEGESVVLDLDIKVRADLDMETVELNRDRTTLRIVPQGQAEKARTLTGADYALLHRAAGLVRIGTSFPAKAGAAWKTALNLSRYTRALPVGKYEIELTYRYGAKTEQSFHARPVTVEVVPAQWIGQNFRWFGGASSHAKLEGLWTAQAGGKTRWLYQTAEPFDPGVTNSCVEISAPTGANSPRLAHLNAIAGTSAERYAVWSEPAGIGFLAFQASGQSAAPIRAADGLNEKKGGAFLAEPPLQRAKGGLSALVIGQGAKSESVASLMEAGADGKTHHTLKPLPEPASALAVVAWGAGETDGAGSLYYGATVGKGRVGRLIRMDIATRKAETVFETSGDLIALTLDQWLGSGFVYGLVREKGGLRVCRWEIGAAHPKTERMGELASLADGERCVQFVALNESAVSSVAALYRKGEAYRIALPGQPPRTAPDAGTLPFLIAAPVGPFFVTHNVNSGFQATALQEPPAAPPSNN